MTDPPLARVAGRSHRLIASRHPTIGVFDDLSDDPADRRVAMQLEMMTNSRLAGAAGRLALLLPDEVVTGPTASIVMAAFLHTDARGGRFHDHRLGAWYAALDLETAIAETVFHNERRLRMSDGGYPNRIQVRELISDAAHILVDIRGQQSRRPALYDPDPDHYSASQAFAAALRWPDAAAPRRDGLVYDSVRRAGGENICLFWPSAVARPLVQGDHYDYVWDRNAQLSVMKLTKI